MVSALQFSVLDKMVMMIHHRVVKVWWTNTFTMLRTVPAQKSSHFDLIISLKPSEIMLAHLFIQVYSSRDTWDQWDSLKGFFTALWERLERRWLGNIVVRQSAQVKKGCWLPTSREERQAVPPRWRLKWVWKFIVQRQETCICAAFFRRGWIDTFLS